MEAKIETLKAKNSEDQEYLIYPRTHMKAVVNENGENVEAFINDIKNTTDEINTEITALKKSVSDGKTLVANAITEKGVSTATDATYATMAENIKSIETGIDTSDATATAEDIKGGKTAYVNGAKVWGSMTVRSDTDQELSAGGSYLVYPGYREKGFTISAKSLASQTAADAAAAQILKDKTAWVNGSKVTGTIPSKEAATITPKTSDQTIAAGQYLSGAQTIKGDSNLVAANIISGKSIFGVSGSASAANSAVAISTFSGSVVGTKVTFTWTLPTDSTRAGVRIVYKTGSAPTSASDGTAIYDTNSYSGTTATSVTYDFKTTGTYYVTIFSYTYVNNVRKYTKGKNITVSCTKVIGFQRITSSGTFTVPAGVTSVDVFLVGGGCHGGKGSCSYTESYTWSAQGGSGGNGAKILTQKGIAVTPGQNITVTIGAGGDNATIFGSYSSANGARITMNYYRAPYVSRSGYGTETQVVGQANSNSLNGKYAFEDATWSASNDNSIQYGAHGGGGGAYRGTSVNIEGATGGITGSGNGGTSTSGKGGNATANTGAGGGGGYTLWGSYSDTTKATLYDGGSGASGCVIVRYGY